MIRGLSVSNPAPAPPAQEYAVAVLGDSTSRTPEGDPPTFTPNGWPQRFSLSGVTIQSTATSGNRTADLPTQWGLVTNNPSLVVIMIGVNDHIVYDRTQEQAQADLSAFVSARVAEGRKVMMVKSLPWGGWGSWESGCETWRETLWSWQLTQCNGTTIVCVDPDGTMADLSTPGRAKMVAAYTYDGLHPGAAGANALADFMEAQIQAIR